MKYSVRALLLAVFLLVSLVIPTITASATTDYDNLLQTTPSLYVYTDGSTMSETIDISGSWWANYKEANAKRVAQNIGWPTNFVSEFESIMGSGGSWGVYVYEGAQGNVINIVGTRDPNAICEFSGPANTGTFQCTSHPGYGFVVAPYFTHNSYGGNGCIGSYQDRCSSNGMGIYDAPTVYTGTAGGTFLSFYNSTLSNYKFFFMNFDINYPDPGYEGIEIPGTRPPAEYVAMGDSFSSGEGVPVFEAGTADENTNECHQSLDAYPRVLQSNPYMGIGSLDFVACSGATTRDVLGLTEGNDPEGKWHSSTDPDQIDAVTENTDMVTITIGGNDIKFGAFGNKCVFGTPELDECDSSSSVYQESWAIMTDSSRSDYLPDALEDTFQAIADNLTVNNGTARVYVVGYPYVLTGMSYLSDSIAEPRCSYLSIGEAEGAEAIVEKLNEVISQAVSDFFDYRFQFVDATDDPGHFAGRELCTINGYFNGIDEGSADEHYTFHPNASGQAAYAALISDFINP